MFNFFCRLPVIGQTFLAKSPPSYKNGPAVLCSCLSSLHFPTPHLGNNMFGTSCTSTCEHPRGQPTARYKITHLINLKNKLIFKFTSLLPSYPPTQDGQPPAQAAPPALPGHHQPRHQGRQGQVPTNPGLLHRFAQHWMR